jgi:hypothetical protein
MISTPDQWRIHAVCNRERRQEDVPVVGWDEDGYALAIDWNAGRLVRALDLPGFSHLDDTVAKAEEVRAAIPAPPGWTLVTRAGEQPVVREIVGWAVNGFGCGQPLVVDHDGSLIVADTEGARVNRSGQSQP